MEGLDVDHSCTTKRQPLEPAPVEARVASANVRLTPRQDEILSLVAAGRSDKEIATRLGLTPRTISKHLERIYTKLQLPNRAAAAAFWTRQNYEHGRTS